MNSPLAVVCDFDGTATLLDIGDEISRHFGGEAHFLEQKRLFASGKLDTRGIIEGIYTHVTASEREVCDFAVSAARLRPGLAELIEACASRGAPFYLASGGLRQYIDAVLARHLPDGLGKHVLVRANEAAFGPAGLKVTFPLDDRSRAMGCAVCGSCKRVSVADVRAGGARHVIGIGDGFADRCLVQFADQAFARADSYLHRHCLEHGVAHKPFTELFDAAKAVRVH
jgi:2-hydroxy-3-keto-5-methylthiopentenyl-1-phosphate phosphatase